MEIKNPVCCGVDVHKKMLVACVRRVGPKGEATKALRTFGTTVADLEALVAWLKDEECPVVAMESTGVYWRPVYHALAEFEVVIGNPREIRQRPGKKTDKADASWIAELLAHGLITQSFIPPPAIDALRSLTRSRVGLIQTRTQAKNRVHKVLEDTGIKLASVVSDLFGKTGRKILEALVDGERDPKKLARLAVGKLLKKIPALELALRGMFTPDHAFLIGRSLELIDLLNKQIHAFDERIAEAAKPIEYAMDLLKSIPGIDARAAAMIVAEIGVDMTRFGRDTRLASWVGICPGNNESAGKNKSGRTRKGNKWLRRVLTQCAWGARRTESYVGRTFRRFEKSIGGKKAALATAHKILVIAFHVLKNGTIYDEDLHKPDPTAEQRRNNRLIERLKLLGYVVTRAAQPTASEVPALSSA